VQNGAFELKFQKEHIRPPHIPYSRPSDDRFFKADGLFKLFRNVRVLRLTSVDDLPKDCPPLLRKICSKWKAKINKQLDNMMQNSKRDWLCHYCYEIQPRSMD
jgi:hypothetical protein